MNVLKEVLINKLNQINWSNLRESHFTIEKLLNEVKNNLIDLQHDLKNLSSECLSNLVELSVETPTHFKWYLHKEPKLGYRIWLHEYKPSSVRRAGYATVAHNHRYWFTSLILKGGFNHRIYDIKRHKNDVSQFDGALLISETFLSEGTIYTVDSEKIHSLTDIREPTITMIIRSPAVRLYSESFDLEKKTVQKHLSFAARIEDFKKIVGGIVDGTT